MTFNESYLFIHTAIRRLDTLCLYTYISFINILHSCKDPHYTPFPIHLRTRIPSLEWTKTKKIAVLRPFRINYFPIGKVFAPHISRIKLIGVMEITLMPDFEDDIFWSVNKKKKTNNFISFSTEILFSCHFTTENDVLLTCGALSLTLQVITYTYIQMRIYRIVFLNEMDSTIPGTCKSFKKINNIGKLSHIFKYKLWGLFVL